MTVPVYATVAECEKDKKKLIFNCYQRAHQNSLEFAPIFLTLFGISAIEFPFAAAISGVIYIAGRYAYAKGYYTGEPKNRMRGGFGYLGIMVLLATSFMTAYRWIAQ